ncbi:allophanate hydrolase [Pelagibacterium halotolerans]|uniref:Allophanate hydrolase n=1 Tax=Pelagibacterium halotolerans (strain DSM 22347 / JCM 15775 / CGMCC 1.7692 / B2) TaxID=1082931 RepID=G4REN2_PELHB|nr:allophanate hydrolase [Pelagibacterium halotolerans]AEQ50882.1 allophanate hydrolase [Pelagibacterium halotolerans B2]QJR19211.1 allophanate hydrolase [Pelagibacterium halotolerans]SDZ98886.1 allophanate hydrolase [Pelagibacterium halotolerans]
MLSELPFTLPALRQAYADGVHPEDAIAEAFRRLDGVADPGIFIHEAREAALAEARALGAPDGRPLWGIPYAVKDNIDVAGMPTTAACPAFSYDPGEDAFVVARLRAAGAICLGKTNLDQFATGLVGVRTPYPVPNNAIDPEIVPGGSSSGSAVAVAHGIACFTLGTDTAGSGRVPAALNNLVGLKPSLGLLSARGVVPACRTLDTVSIFAFTVSDAYEVFSAAAGFDAADAYARDMRLGPLARLPADVTIAVPDEATLETFGDMEQADHFHADIDRLQRAGVTVKSIDMTPFFDVARMLYEGAWVAERTAAVGARITEAPETLHPTTLAIVSDGLEKSAVDAFEGIYKLQALKRRCEGAMEGVDLLCVPTIPNFVTRAEIKADPIGPNARLGTYTNFVNLLDMCGIAVPTGSRADGRPGNMTVLARAGEDDRAAALALTVETGLLGATRWLRPAAALPDAQPRDDEIAIAVCGAHMSGLPLNSEITSRGGRFVSATETAPDYALYALADGPPFRPGLVRVGRGAGVAVPVEIWALPQSAFGGFMAGVPSPLCIGNVVLQDGTVVKGFVCESAGIEGAVDISALGGWRSYLAHGTSPEAVAT